MSTYNKEASVLLVCIVAVDGRSGNLSFILSCTIVVARSFCIIASGKININLRITRQLCYVRCKLKIRLSLSFKWISKDGKLLLSARILRTFAYGFLSIVISIYLKLLGFDEFLIGLVLTFTLVNSIIFTLVASFYADRIGRKKMLIIYAVLMSISGAIFFVTTNYVALIIAALIGTINVTGTETGAFLSVEQEI